MLELLVVASLRYHDVKLSLPSYACMTDMTIEIRFTSVTNYSSAVLRFRICSQTMNFDLLRRHTVLKTVASQGFKYAGQQKTKTIACLDLNLNPQSRCCSGQTLRGTHTA